VDRTVAQEEFSSVRGGHRDISAQIAVRIKSGRRTDSDSGRREVAWYRASN
jgi:hypothetical protein